MKVLVPGYRYELGNFENKGQAGQVLQFIHKEPKADGIMELEIIMDGTTNEEVLAVVLDRIESLQAKFPCQENAKVIANLKDSLIQFAIRTANRKKRSVEGKQIA